MTNGISEDRQKWLTYLVYLLLLFLTTVSGWLIVDRIGMPKEFVRLERYTEDKKAQSERYSCDMGRIEKSLATINGKLDNAIIYRYPRGGDG